jgi:uncharacterized protein YgiM (DUF1202 family)
VFSLIAFGTWLFLRIDKATQQEPAVPPAAEEPQEPADVPPPAVPAEPPAVQPEPNADIRYDEELRANWDVAGVMADDVLNVREVPGVGADITAKLDANAKELESTGRIAYVGDSLWREIVVPGDGTGWVNAAYLAETAPPPTIEYGNELRANWDVTGVASDDVLNVRTGPGITFPVAETLAPDAAELESTGRIAHVNGTLWRNIVVPGNGTGWVNASFLVPTS